MTVKEFRLDRKSTGAHQLEGLWGPLEGDLLYDMSAKNGGMGHHGTRAGTGPRSQRSTRGQVPLFNGVDDYYQCDGPMRISHDTFTVMAWVWLDSTGLDDKPTAVGSGAGGASDWLLAIYDADVAGSFLRFNGVAITAAAAAGSFHPLKDSWAHIAAVRWHDGGSANAQMDLYQNGLLVGNDNVAHSTFLPYEIVQIGQSFGRANRWWQGMIDDVRYYSRALTGAQIHYIYRRTKDTPYADLMLRPTRRLVHRHRGALEAD